PAGDVLTVAAQQARKTGFARRYLAQILGTVGTLVTATTAMGQIERALNRIYGIEQDRPAVQKYGRALVLALSAGLLAGHWRRRSAWQHVAERIVTPIRRYF
ncbi:MAG TPA: hypothetical protein VKD67_05615, partial [Acidimicrobiales bacterium]|nr:hypothetical protein [Acidimicrobiales bacterium]